MKARLYLVLILILFGSFHSLGAAESPYIEMVEDFFAAIEEGKAVDGVDKLYASNPWMSRAKDAVDNVKTQFSGLSELVGAYQGHTLVVEKVIADRLAYLNYFVAYERSPFDSSFFSIDRRRSGCSIVFRWMTTSMRT